MSVAVHVTTVSPSGKNSGASFVIVTSCISDTDGLSRETVFSSIEVASYVKSSTGEISGEVVSTTETNCVSLAVFSEESDTVHVIIVSPSGKNSGASLVIDITPKISYPVGDSKSTIFSYGTTASTIISETGDMVGDVVSTTLTSCVAIVEFPLLSIAVHMIIAVPKPNLSGALLIIN